MDDKDKTFMDSLEKDVQAIALRVSVLPTRTEIETMLSSRVSNDRFEALVGRVSTIESNPRNFRDWVAMGVGCLGLFLSFIAVAITVIITLAGHWH